MSRIIIVFLLIFSVFSIKAQSQIKGRVLSEDGIPLGQTLIINIKTGDKFYTNHEGSFNIIAKIMEEIRIVKKGYNRISHIVKSSDFEEDVEFKMQKSEILIDEVVITKISKQKLDELQKGIGVPKTNWKSRDKVSRAKDVLLPLVSGTLNIQAIKDIVSGDSRRRKNLYKYEDFQENVSWIKDRIEISFFTEKGIPEERISEFISFALVERADIKANIKTRNIRKIETLLEDVLPIYVKRLSELK